MTTERGTLHALGAYGLAGAMTRLPEGPLEEPRFDALLRDAAHSGLQGPLAWAVANGALGATAGQRRRAVARHEDAMIACLCLEQLLLEVLGPLRAADADVRVLKGPVLAHTAYGDPTLRTFRDIDLLVPARDTERVLEVLVGLGLRPDARASAPGSTRIATLYTEDGRALDLRTTIVPPGLAVEVGPGALFPDPVSFRLAGVPVPALPPELQLLHACLEAVETTPPRPAVLRDVAQLVLRAGVDADAAVGLAERWSVLPVVALAVTRTWEAFRLADRVPLSEWASRYETAPSDQRRLASVWRPPAGSPAGGGPPSGMLTRLRNLLSPGRAGRASGDPGRVATTVRRDEAGIGHTEQPLADQ